MRWLYKHHYRNHALVTTQLGTAVLSEAYQPIKVCHESSAQKVVRYYTHAGQMYPVDSK